MQKAEIHNSSNFWRHRFPRHHLLAACGISLSVTLLLSILPDSVIAFRSAKNAAPEANLTIKPLPQETSVVVEPKITEQPDPWLHLIVKKGDTLSSLLQKAGLNANDIHELANSGKDAKELAELDLGDELDVLLKNGKIEELRLHRNKLESIAVKNGSDGYETKKISRTPSINIVATSGVIDSSLFLSGQKAGLDDQMTLQLAEMFAYDIDFAQDIQPGDKFSVLYEKLSIDGENIGNGRILAAEFINDGKTYNGVLFSDKNGRSNYYTPDGRLMRKQFLRTPLDFARITSYFNLSRMHPILHKIRAHKGVDYAAPQGTPIKAAGDGTVVFAGVRNGFGNVVMIQHGSAYTTVYGHMQKISVRNGAHVEQGQVIGLVGSTGLATAPHLHYEFHVNGTAVNPLSNMNMAMAEPLSKTEKMRFTNTATPLIAQLHELAHINKNTSLPAQQLALGDRQDSAQ